MKVGIYIRVSTNHQDNSVDMQREKCLAFCKLKNYDVVDVFVDEHVSGSKKIFERPEGKRMNQSLKKGEVEHIVTLKLDRMFRSTLDGLNTLEELSARGHTISIIDHGGMTIDTASATGKMFITFLLGFAELERNQISDRITAVSNHKKAKKEVYCGKTPYGFEKKGNKLKPVKKELDKVREFFSILKDESIPKSEKSLRKLAMKLQIDHVKLHRISKNDLYREYI